MKRIFVLGFAAFSVALFSARADDVKALFDTKCAKCHGTDGKGDTTMGKKLGTKDYSDSKVQAELKDDAAFKAIKEGLKKNDKTLMKPIEGAMDDQIKGLVAYLRSFKK